jgi:hypothetical protein
MFYKRILAGIIVFLVLPYARSPIYRFPPPQPFTGSQLWNPYSGLEHRWRRANFHAHGRAWGGLTSGAQSDADVLAAYRRIGYDIATVSDYQHISQASASDIPSYEHGFNVGKHHQLAIGAHDVQWFDFPFWQGRHQKQFIIDLVRSSSDLIAIDHPSRRHSYTPDDVTALTGYELIEVANGRVTTEDRWDAALSSGHPVWGIGGDDSHDVTDADRMGIAWNMIDAATLSRSDVVNALRAGRSYVVVRAPETSMTAGDLTVADVGISGQTLTVQCEGPPATIVFIGRQGRVRKSVMDATSASYAFAPDDSYVRTVVHGTRTTLFLNPIIRTEGGAPPAPAATIDWRWTTATRSAIVAGCVVVAWLLLSRPGAGDKRV